MNTTNAFTINQISPVEDKSLPRVLIEGQATLEHKILVIEEINETNFLEISFKLYKSQCKQRKTKAYSMLGNNIQVNMISLSKRTKVLKTV